MKFLFAAAFLALAATFPVAAQQPAASSSDDLRQEMRRDKRGLVERNMQLTPAEAAKFWPIYDAYQKDLDRVIERENRLILDFIHSENSMTDANAKRIALELLKAEDDEQALRNKQFRRMLAVLPARRAARYLQIESKLRTIQRYDVGEQLDLVR